MAECKKCEGLGTKDCEECTVECFNFFIGRTCPTCAGMLIIPCPECAGSGQVPDEDD
ncbi:hypothetical protein [Caldalkalibacillus salinus]|uniref:hypothetical protein n=1 Tax=Caldalkalibacillus salinus TaxID=2803787 RepID=UPI001923DA57|nr:hypothetical protein [Caldalkalibacillus salinus]